MGRTFAFSLIILSAFFSGCIQPEKKGSIEGSITLENVAEYAGIKVSLTAIGLTAPTQSTGFTATTQSNGFFQILDVPEGSYKITADKEGFVLQEMNIEVRAKEITTVNLVLQREISMPPSLPNP